MSSEPEVKSESESEIKSIAVIPAESPINILDYIFMMSYPVAFVGSIFLCINSFINLQSIINKQVLYILIIYIGISGFFSLLLWFQPSNLPLISSGLNNISTSLRKYYNINTIKTSSNS
jgi:hypothetical protein